MPPKLLSPDERDLAFAGIRSASTPSAEVHIRALEWHLLAVDASPEERRTAAAERVAVAQASTHAAMADIRSDTDVLRQDVTTLREALVRLAEAEAAKHHAEAQAITAQIEREKELLERLAGWAREAWESKAFRVAILTLVGTGGGLTALHDVIRELLLALVQPTGGVP